MTSAQAVTYRVDLTTRAARDLARLYRNIDAEHSAQARTWFDGLEAAVKTLDQNPARGAIIPEDHVLRHLLYGHKPNLYRIIYAIDNATRVVTVVHVRHGARDAFRT